MAAYLSCLSVGGGVPLFTRRQGDVKALPFPLLASLNGVALFSGSQDVTLVSTLTEECKLMWREYHKSVRLIVAVPHDTLSEVHLHRLLDNVFQSMVLLVGLEELSGNLRNIDRTKRDLKAAYPMIDLLLENAVAPSGSDPTRTINFADLVGCADCVAFPEANLVTNYLEGFVESVDSTYGCVSVHGGVVSATSNWFFLHPDETMLLSLYLQSESHASTLRDVPVFLPVKSPTVPFRLVTCDLVSGVTVSVLCGPSPSLSDLEDILGKCWGSSQPLLASLQSIHPRRFPLVKVDTSVLAFMVINLDTRKVLSSLQPHYCSSGDAGGVTKKTEGSDMSPARKSDILRSFYRMTVGPIFPDIFIANPYGVDPTSGEALAYKAVPHAQLSHGVSDTYVVSEFHKCYALQHMQFQLFAIFMSAVPNHSMRNIANRTLDLVIKDKAFSIIK